MRQIEVDVPPKHVKWFVMNRSFPLVVTFHPGYERASLSDDHHYDLYKAPGRALHVKRKGGPVLGTITEEGVVGAITEEAAKDLKALRAAYFEVDYEFVIAHMFRREGRKGRSYVHARCRDEFARHNAGVELTPQYYLKGTPDCAACGGSIE
mgnify:FL=1